MRELRAILSSVLFVALVLAGFGSLEYFADPPRVLFLLIGLIAAYVSGRGRPAMKKGKEQGESNPFFLLLIGLTIAAGFFLPFFAARKIGAWNFAAVFRYAGVLAVTAGFILRMIAIRTLKRQFSIYVAIQENHQLITTGIYSHIRHPIYLGALFSLIGFALVFPTLPGFLFVLIYSMLLGRRMAREERLMFKHFGSVYEEYFSKSYRLIPHVY